MLILFFLFTNLILSLNNSYLYSNDDIEEAGVSDEIKLSNISAVMAPGTFRWHILT